jgi:hypothetical protein
MNEPPGGFFRADHGSTSVDAEGEAEATVRISLTGRRFEESNVRAGECSPVEFYPRSLAGRDDAPEGQHLDNPLEHLAKLARDRV